MRLHDRTLPVQAAGNALAKACDDLAEEHGLTDVELLQALNAYQQRVLKYMLRSERHPDHPDKKGDEA
jgi:hypothetical protein